MPAPPASTLWVTRSGRHTLLHYNGKKVLTSVNWCPLGTHRLRKCALRLPQVSGERGTQCHRCTKINHMGTSSGHCTLAAQGDESKTLVGPEALAPRAVTVSTGFLLCPGSLQPKMTGDMMHGLSAKRTSPTSVACGLTEVILTPAIQSEPSEHRAHSALVSTAHTPRQVRLADSG